MRKYLLKFVMLITVIPVLSLVSCKPDSFDEEDAMNLQNKLNKDEEAFSDSLNRNDVRVSFILSLVDASKTTLLKGENSETGLTGATVTVGQTGVLTTKTSDATGLIMFNDLKPGPATINVSLKDYSEVSAVVDLGWQGSATGGSQVGCIIPMFSLTGASTATIKGRISFESDLINLTDESVPSGTKVIATVSTSSPALSNIKTGIITSISYGGLSLEAVTDANGNYSISVPGTSSGLDYNLRVSDFISNQRLLMSTLNGVPVTGVQTVPTEFGSTFTSGSTTVPGLVVYPVVTISAPDYTYTPATATATITGGVVTALNITDGGANYRSGEVTVTISSPTVGTVATATATVGVDYRITNLAITNGGTGYTTAPTVTITSTIEKIQAIANATTNADGEITGINVPNVGEGYLTAPTVTIAGGIPNQGSGATATATISLSTTRISNIAVNTHGTNYVARNTPGFTINAPLVSSTRAVATGTSLKDIYLGTGKRTIED